MSEKRFSALEKSHRELMLVLADSLRKQDQMLERMESSEKRFEKHEELFEKQFNRLDLAYQIILSHSKSLDSVQDETRHLTENVESLNARTKELYVKYDSAQVEINQLKMECRIIEKEISGQRARNDAEMLALSKKNSIR